MDDNKQIGATNVNGFSLSLIDNSWKLNTATTTDTPNQNHQWTEDENLFTVPAIDTETVDGETTYQILAKNGNVMRFFIDAVNTVTNVKFVINPTDDAASPKFEEEDVQNLSQATILHLLKSGAEPAWVEKLVDMTTDKGQHTFVTAFRSKKYAKLFLPRLRNQIESYENIPWARLTDDDGTTSVDLKQCTFAENTEVEKDEIMAANTDDHLNPENTPTTKAYWRKPNAEVLFFVKFDSPYVFEFNVKTCDVTAYEIQATQRIIEQGTYDKYILWQIMLNDKFTNLSLDDQAFELEIEKVTLTEALNEIEIDQTKSRVINRTKRWELDNNSAAHSTCVR
eukprot:GHVT01025826.1.p1 GENE.GHVT01025826.1~~GHVT01025826.1.p1  ORF type:complete len:339 (+),score=35.98 GHVT01025826.1:272-1288(+)